MSLLLGLDPAELTNVSSAITLLHPNPPATTPVTDSPEVVGARLNLRGVYLTAAALVIVALITIFGTKDTPVACGDERTKAVQLVKRNPDIWVDYNADSPVQKQCQVNEIVKKQLAK